jgi:hypothetical protein
MLTLGFSCTQGDTDRPRPCARQDAQVGSARADEAAFIEGATGGGGGGRATAQHGCGHGATARSGGSGGDHGGGDSGGVGVAVTYPCRG